MVYYAKSKNEKLSRQKKAELERMLLELTEELEELTDGEKKGIAAAATALQAGCSEVQKTLAEHQQDIVSCAERFFTQYGQYFTQKEKKLVIEACRIHDYGKANLLFQALVRPEYQSLLSQKDKNSRQIPHGFLSAASISRKEFYQWAEDLDYHDFAAFVTAVFHHHTRRDEATAELDAYAEQYYIKYIKDYLKREDFVLQPSNLSLLLFRNRESSAAGYREEERWNQYVLMKGLLNKFDYTVSAGYKEAEIEPDLIRKTLKHNVLEMLDGRLRPAQQFMAQAAEQSVVIAAPTGSGKTEAALLWLNGEKGFYTLPLKVSSNAIYERIRGRYGYKAAALLHSDSMQKYLEKSGEGDADAGISYERARLLANPLTVCTVDQLFRFVYRALGTEVYAATLKYSKVIIDEIQAYSPRVIATIIYGLKQITEMGGRFAIITATFPPVLAHFMEKYGLVQGKDYLYRDFSKDSQLLRHRIALRQKMDVEELAEQGKTKKVLVICNTVSNAQSIYEQITAKTEAVYLLHSRYIRRDRAVLEEMIMDFSDDENAVGIWVTTQIVEASLDIDFDILHTEMCPADGLLQRMGRCNRRGRYLPESANVFVYDNRNGVGKNSVYDTFLYDCSMAALRAYEDELLSEAMKTKYINQVYCLENLQKSAYYEEIDKFLQHFSTIPPAAYKPEEAKAAFRSIRSITVVPETLYTENMHMFDRILSFLKTPYIGSEVRSILLAKLNSLTLSLNCYKGLPAGVDVAALGEQKGHLLDGIHRVTLCYEFDKKSRKGRGLLLNQIQDEDYFL